MASALARCDNNGNLLQDNLHSYVWDINNRAVTIDSSIHLIYDALGREVETQNGSTYTEFVYALGQKLAVMNGQTQTKAFVPLPGGAQVQYAGSAISTYQLPDWLGSLRVGAKQNRTYSWGVAFAPFGERYASKGSPAFTFTGDNEDIASGLYDFTFRELSNSQGRWVSPDPAGLAAVNPTNPQTWNRYAYVGNTPTGAVDPLGLNSCDWKCRENIWARELNNDLAFFPTSGYGCQIEEMPAPCNFAYGLLGDAGAYCPQCQPGQTVGQDNKVYGWKAPLFGADCYNTGCGPMYLKDPGGWEPIGTVDSPIFVGFAGALPPGMSGAAPANNGWQQGPDPVAVANSMKQYVKAQASNCYNGFHQTPGGRVTQAFSALALFPVANNSQNNQLSLGAEILGKLSLVAGSNSAGGVFTAFLEGFTANVTTPAYILGTGADAGALLLCGAGAATSIHP